MKPISTHILSREHIYKCFSCNYMEIGGELIEAEKIKSKKIKEGIVKDENVFADYQFKCKKCGYDKAQIVERQPYISDEDTLIYLKCGKCGWMENLARKIM